MIVPKTMPWNVILSAHPVILSAAKDLTDAPRMAWEMFRCAQHDNASAPLSGLCLMSDTEMDDG